VEFTAAIFNIEEYAKQVLMKRRRTSTGLFDVTLQKTVFLKIDATYGSAQL
jgi:hypothetical protein